MNRATADNGRQTNGAVMTGTPGMVGAGLALLRWHGVCCAGGGAAEPCVGHSRNLDPEQCGAWQTFFDGATGVAWRPIEGCTTPSTNNRNDPCICSKNVVCEGWPGEKNLNTLSFGGWCPPRTVYGKWSSNLREVERANVV